MNYYHLGVYTMSISYDRYEPRKINFDLQTATPETCHEQKTHGHTRDCIVHAKYWRENVQQRHLSHNTSTHTRSGLGIGESVEDLLGAQ